MTANPLFSIGCIQNHYGNPKIFYKIFWLVISWVLGLHITYRKLFDGRLCGSDLQTGRLILPILLSADSRKSSQSPGEELKFDAETVSRER
jgi:hypothetical protein